MIASQFQDENSPNNFSETRIRYNIEVNNLPKRLIKDLNNYPKGLDKENHKINSEAFEGQIPGKTKAILESVQNSQKSKKNQIIKTTNSIKKNVNEKELSIKQSNQSDQDSQSEKSIEKKSREINTQVLQFMKKISASRRFLSKILMERLNTETADNPNLQEISKTLKCDKIVTDFDHLCKDLIKHREGILKKEYLTTKNLETHILILLDTKIRLM